MRSRCAGRGGAGLWVKPRGTKRRTLQPCADAVLPPGILRANRRMRFSERCSALVPLLRNGANHGSASAPKAKQKRACRLFFAWYSRWESNPERPLRRGLLYPFNYGSISYYPAGNTSSLRSSCHRKRWGEPEMIFPASMQKHILLSRLGILRRCAPRATASGGAHPE